MRIRVLGLALLGLGLAGARPLPAADPASTVPVTRPARQPANKLTLDLGNRVTLVLARLPAGKFLMGSPATETDAEHGRPTNELLHAVTIGKPFYLGVTEVTQWQYEAVLGKNPSQFKGPNHPVDQVAWANAVEFCQKLSARTGQTVRLPTEAEWEYACRAGSQTRYSCGDQETNLGEFAWYLANSLDRKTGVRTTHPVGQKKPNAWGLFDLHGNVWEWCADWYAPDYGPAAPTDPRGPATGSIHVLRGGSWNYCAFGCRVAGRGRIGPDGQYDANGGGFRVAVAAE